MRPIPRRILVHSVTYSARASVDEYNNPTYATGVPVSFVRLEPVKMTALRALGELKDDKFTLYYDCENSEPTGVAFKELDKITYNGSDYIIRSISDFSPHHLEMVLK